MIEVEGANGFNRHRFENRGGGQPMATIQAKRPVKIRVSGELDAAGTYSTPTMAEVNAARGSSGLRGVSLFAGGGGSSTGWALAGFSVLWANEFTRHAAATYRANHAETIVDERSIRDVKPEEILEVLSLKPGELDFLDGSPPCDAFSTAGKRDKGWGKKKAYYTGQHRQRTDDLFFEYIRILEGLRPRAFIAENVSGLIKGRAKGRFIQIVKALKAIGYRVEVKVLDAQWLGVPQCRQRVIFQGSRDGRELRWPKPHTKRISMREAIGTERGLVGVAPKRWTSGKRFHSSNPAPVVMKDGIAGSARHQVLLEAGHEPLPPSRRKAYERRRGVQLHQAVAGEPAPTITISSPGNDVGHWEGPRKLTIPELKAICSFPADYKLLGSYAEQWAICGMSVPPLMMFEIAKCVREGLGS